MIETDGLTLCWILVTAVSCGAWLGWFSGRRYEKSKAVLRRMRGYRRSPVKVVMDVDFMAGALRQCGYEVSRLSGKGQH